MRASDVVAGVLFAAVLAYPAAAQQRAFVSGVTPFFNGELVAYEPEIGVVTTGTNLVLQPTVSHDRKYVTIGGQFQQTRVLAIENFPVVSTVFAGPVGGAIPADPTPLGPQDMNVSAPVQVQQGQGGGVLNRPGMTFIRAH